MAHPPPVTQITVEVLAWKSLPMPENRLMAASALAGTRKRQKPVKTSLVLQARHVVFRVSVKICRNRNADLTASGKNRIGKVVSTTQAASPSPSQWRAMCGARDITASEPNAPPPRLATLVHPLTEPRRWSGVNCAVQPQIAPE